MAVSSHVHGSNVKYEKGQTQSCSNMTILPDLLMIISSSEDSSGSFLGVPSIVECLEGVCSSESLLFELK